MVNRLVSFLWGSFESNQEIKKFGFLSLIFGVIIGTNWSLKPIKDSVLGATVGIDYQPWAKVLSLFIVVPLILIYSKLIDLFPRHKVFYTIATLYGFAALTFAYFFMHPVYGLPNTQEDPSRIIGWLWYVFVESYGSLFVALFWAFTTDITKPEAATRGFPMIILLGQIGNMVGPFFLNAHRWGFANSAPIIAICGLLTFCIGILVMLFMKVTPADQMVGYEAVEEVKIEKTEKKEGAGFFEGLKILFSQPYLLGIFLIISLYEVVITLLDFFFKTSVKEHFPQEAANAAYLSQYAVYAGTVAMLCVLFGINNIQRFLGMRISLFMLPAFICVAVLTLWFVPTLSIAFWVMVCSKAISHSLNSPSLKQLYIPTKKEVKYKAQAWIEVFGARGAKATGAGINMFRGMFKSSYGAVLGTSLFLNISSSIALGFICIWIFMVLFVSKKYTQAIKDNSLVC